MRNIWIIAKREYKLYFTSPVAYLIITLVLFLLGILFFRGLSAYSQQQLSPGVDLVLYPLGFFLVIFTPAITTRLLAEEQRMGTIEMLLTAPVRDWELVVGKWLGAFLFYLTIILISLVYPLILNQLVDPGIDQGPLISGYLGLILLVAALLAVGVFISSLFANQVAAFFATLGAIVFLWWFFSIIGQGMSPTSPLRDVIVYLDFSDHYYTNPIRGIIDLRDVVFYLSATALGLFLATVSVETRRWR